MKIARVLFGGSVCYGVVQGDSLFSLAGHLFGDFSVGQRLCRLSDAILLAPVMPSKIVAVGPNYAAHAAEFLANSGVPDEPNLFLKSPTAVVGHLEPVIYPRQSTALSYEAELAIAIGRRAKDVAAAEAASYILGYTCGNDVTARDIQRREGHLTHSKCFDTFCPLGPYIVTDVKAGDLRIQCRVNGATKQDSRTSGLVHGIDKLVSFISEIMTLLPGDLILTGTPEGIGLVDVGDVMEVEIEGIGVLRNPIAAYKP